MSAPAVASVKKQSSTSKGDICSGMSEVIEIWTITFVTAGASAFTARNASGIPAWGAQFSEFSTSYNLYVLEKSAVMDSNDANGIAWIVTVTYKTPSADALFPNNGTGHKWQVLKSLTPYPVEVPLQRDLNGKPLVNCINEPIRPNPTDVVYDQEVRVNFLTDQLDQTSIDACLNKLNSTAITLTIAGCNWVASPSTLKFLNAPVVETYNQDGNIIGSVGMLFMYRSNGWTAQYPNLSYNYATSSGATPTPILDGGSITASDPRYLDSLGGTITAGGTITFAGGGTLTGGFTLNSTHDFTTLLSEIAV